MKFELPDNLTSLSRAELEELRAQAEQAFDATGAEVGESVTADTVAELKRLTEVVNTIGGRLEEVVAEEQARLAEAQALLDQRAARQAEPEPTPEPEPEPEPTPEPEPAVVTEAEKIVAEAPEPAVAASTAKPDFRGLASKAGRSPADSVPPAPQVGFRMRPQVPEFRDGVVGYEQIAAAIEKANAGTRIVANRGAVLDRHSLVPLSLATLERQFSADRIVTAENDRELEEQVDRIVEATDWKRNEYKEDGALAASLGWCSPSETIYDFCDVTPASGLITLPDLNITRGGLRRPALPDFSELYNTLPFRYTEAELLADPTKPCIEIPCVEMEEIRLSAIGMCVTAGILQRRGWPELIERFMKEVMKAYQVKLSVWTILDMVAGSNAITVPTASVLGATGSFLNSLELRATVIRQKQQLAHDAPIEGVTEAWMLAVARADMANQQGRDVKSVTDQQVDSWLADRNINMQWVQHWQPLPEASVVYPDKVQVLLYPQGTWYRHLSNVIEVGTLYDKAQLQKNRYTELFVEDEYLVDKRCLTSEVITVPLCANGAVGARQELVCTATTNEVQTGTITGSPTGGTFTLTYLGETTDAIAYNASAATVQAALAMLPTIGAGNVAVSGNAGGPYAITFQGALGATNVALITADGAFTGGTDPDIAVVQTTPGAPN